VFNSFRRGEGPYSEYMKVATPGNEYERFAYTARLDLAPLGRMDASVPDIDRSTKLTLNLGGGYFYNDGVSFKINAVAADLHVKWMGVALMGGYLFDLATPTENPNEVDSGLEDVARMGWWVEADYTIFRRLLGVHVRYERLDLDDRLEDQNDQALWSAGVNIYAYDHLAKFQVEYQHRQELWGGSPDNDTLLTQMQVAF
jgi:hypothetical protein